MNKCNASYHNHPQKICINNYYTVFEQFRLIYPWKTAQELSSMVNSSIAMVAININKNKVLINKWVKQIETYNNKNKSQ